MKGSKTINQRLDIISKVENCFVEWTQKRFY